MECKNCQFPLPLCEPERGRASELWICRNCGQHVYGVSDSGARTSIRSNAEPFCCSEESFRLRVVARFAQVNALAIAGPSDPTGERLAQRSDARSAVPAEITTVAYR
jgi:hypothetical protein